VEEEEEEEEEEKRINTGFNEFELVSHPAIAMTGAPTKTAARAVGMRSSGGSGNGGIRSTWLTSREVDDVEPVAPSCAITTAAAASPSRSMALSVPPTFPWSWWSAGDAEVDASSPLSTPTAPGGCAIQRCVGCGRRRRRIPPPATTAAAATAAAAPAPELLV